MILLRENLLQLSESASHLVLSYLGTIDISSWIILYGESVSCVLQDV